eukprot:EG_transcript_27606
MSFETPFKQSSDPTFVVCGKEMIFSLSKQCGRIQYSEKYSDDVNEYRHVILPKEISKILPKGKLMTERCFHLSCKAAFLFPFREWRSVGVQQSLGWEHYLIHRPEP